MNRRTILSICMALGLGGFTPIAAHDDKIHKATVGAVVAVTADGLQLKTKDALVKVKYSSKTTFELNEKPADRAALKVGDRIGVIGSKLPTGEIMANEVILGVPSPKPDAKKPDRKH